MSPKICILLCLICVITATAGQPQSGTNTNETAEASVLAVYNKAIFRKHPENVQTIRDEHLFRARRGADIVVLVQQLDKWLLSEVPPSSKGDTNDQARIQAVRARLIPFLNDNPMVGCNPINTSDTGISNITEIEFQLTVDQSKPESIKAWKNLLGGKLIRNPWKYRMKVTVGLDTGEYISATAVTLSDHAAQPFFLEIIAHDWSTWAAFLFLMMIGIWFCKNIDLIRDPQALLRPDGSAPFSLARAQMAWWFFLVLTGYLIMWAETGQTDTITSSILVLIGISSGTMLAATFVDKGKDREGGRHQNKRLLGKEQTPKQLVDVIVAEKEKAQQGYDGCRNDLLNIPADLTVSREKNLKEQTLLEERIERLQLQEAFYRRSRWQSFTADILGDNGVLDFHRFQIAAFTLVLGVIFVEKVLSDLAMPDFDATLLGLMGISSGTYIGMKLPEGAK